MREGLRGRRVAPVGVVEHDVERRSIGGAFEHRADAAQQAVASTLGGDDPVGPGLLCRSRNARSAPAPATPAPAPPAWRGSPAISSSPARASSPIARTQGSKGPPPPAGSAPGPPSPPAHGPRPRPRRRGGSCRFPVLPESPPPADPGAARRLAQRRDLAVAADQRLLHVGSEHRRQPNCRVWRACRLARQTTAVAESRTAAASAGSSAAAASSRQIKVDARTGAGTPFNS